MQLRSDGVPGNQIRRDSICAKAFQARAAPHVEGCVRQQATSISSATVTAALISGVTLRHDRDGRVDLQRRSRDDRVELQPDRDGRVELQPDRDGRVDPRRDIRRNVRNQT